MSEDDISGLLVVGDNALVLTVERKIVKSSLKR